MSNAERNQKLKQIKKVHRSGRFFYFIGSKLLLVTLLLALILFSFLTCARLSNSYILINEGMAKRCEFILQEVPLSDMRLYFTEKCMLADTRLNDTSYEEYTVTDYSYSLTFEKLKVWPWLSTISAVVVEETNGITGTPNSGADTSAPPLWQPIRYGITMVKENGSWRIDSVTVQDLNPELKPAASPNPDATPLPMATPTPRPAEEVS